MRKFKRRVFRTCPDRSVLFSYQLDLSDKAENSSTVAL